MEKEEKNYKKTKNFEDKINFIYSKIFDENFLILFNKNFNKFIKKPILIFPLFVDPSQFIINLISKCSYNDSMSNSIMDLYLYKFKIIITSNIKFKKDEKKQNTIINKIQFFNNYIFLKTFLEFILRKPFLPMNLEYLKDLNIQIKNFYIVIENFFFQFNKNKDIIILDIFTTYKNTLENLYNMIEINVMKLINLNNKFTVESSGKTDNFYTDIIFAKKNFIKKDKLDIIVSNQYQYDYLVDIFFLIEYLKKKEKKYNNLILFQKKNLVEKINNNNNNNNNNTVFFDQIFKNYFDEYLLLINKFSNNGKSKRLLNFFNILNF